MDIRARTEVWIEIVAELVAGPPRPEWSSELLRPLSETFDAPASWSWATADGGSGFVAWGLRGRWPDADALVAWARELRAVHPLVRWYAATGDPAALTIGRVPRVFTSGRDLAEAGAFYGQYGLEQQLSIPLFVAGPAYEAFVVGRSGEDFSDEDVALARQVQPLLCVVRRQAGVLAGRAAPTTSCEVGLSAREVAVVCLLAEGLTAAAIGRRLCISERTVHKHLEHAYRKLGVRDRMSAVGAASSAGLLRPLSTVASQGEIDDLLVFEGGRCGDVPEGEDR